MHADYLITGGRVIDPANNIDGVADVAVAAGRIAAVGPNLSTDNPACARYDATGQWVIPGMVDIHIHGYQHGIPLGIDTDHFCLRRGVTTAVDAGSAGFDTFAGFRAFAVDRFQTRLLGFLNISRAGLSFAGLGSDEERPGELESIRFCGTDGCIRCIEENRDILVGVKIRLSDSDCPGKMRPGDIYTHCYHGFRSTIVDPETRQIDPAVLAARDAGVLFDIGHGQGSFFWPVAEIAAAAGFWPDTISTDLHAGTCDGPCYDMPTVLTRLLHVGMPVTDMIRASTVAPAAAIGWDDRVGTLGVGREADIAVLTVDEIDVDLEDCAGQMRRVRQRIRAAAVWRAGCRAEISEPAAWPNQELFAAEREFWPLLQVRDASL
jgi:dihydroorotase